jgi:hypothetical protein
MLKETYILSDRVYSQKVRETDPGRQADGRRQNDCDSNLMLTKVNGTGFTKGRFRKFFQTVDEPRDTFRTPVKLISYAVRKYRTDLKMP